MPPKTKRRTKAAIVQDAMIRKITPQTRANDGPMLELKDIKHPGSKTFLHICVFFEKYQEMPDTLFNILDEQIGTREAIIHTIGGEGFPYVGDLRQYSIDKCYRFKEWTYDQENNMDSPETIELFMLDTLKEKTVLNITTLLSQ